MNLTRDRLHTIGWGTALAIVLALLAVLTTRVNAVKSQVALTDRQIALVSQEKIYLETEFETRANQQQLRAMNDVDFGYTAPTAAQYLKSERDLAMLGKAAGPDAPEPIRFAEADAGHNAGTGTGTVAGQVAPGASGQAASAATHARPAIKVASLNTSLGASLNERLSRLDRAEGAGGLGAGGADAGVQAGGVAHGMGGALAARIAGQRE